MSEEIKPTDAKDEGVTSGTDSNGKKGSRRRRGRDKKKDPNYKYNNLAFYVQSKEVLENITQLSFQNFLGQTKIGATYVPTMAIIYLNPSPGVTWSGATPDLSHPDRTGINIATLNLFNRLAMNSGRTMQYAPQDIASLELQLGQLYSTMSYIRRCFGLRNCHQSYNRMFPKAMIHNLGLDYNDFIRNYANYRDYINSEIDRLNQLPMLINTGYLMKSMTQFEYVFKDSDSDMSQLYAFVPASTWLIDEDEEIQGTRLKTIPFTCDLSGIQRVRTMEWIVLNVLRPMIDALLTSSTFNLIYADLLNLANKDKSFKFFTFDYIDGDKVVEPIHNYEALLHIHNLSIVGTPTLTEDARDRTITAWNDVIHDPDNNAIVYNPAFYIGGDVVVPQQYAIFDAGTAHPSPEAKLEMSRYKSLLTNNSWTVEGKKYFTYAILTDWYATNMRVYRANTLNDGQSSAFFTDVPSVRNWNDDTMSALTQFDWHPICTKYDTAVTTGFNATTVIFGDLDFSTTVDQEYLARVHNQVYIGLFKWI